MMSQPAAFFLIINLSVTIINMGKSHVIPPETAVAILSNQSDAESGSGTLMPRDYAAEINANMQLHFEVNEESPYCQFTNRVLTCDFHWNGETVHVPALPHTRGSLEELFIQNVHRLKLDRVCCSKLILHHIGSILTNVDPPAPPCQEMVVRLLNVSLDQLPAGMTTIHASNAIFATVSLGENVITASLSDTKIQYLRTVTESKKLQLKLQNASIERLENLRLSGNSTLNFHNCSIGDLSENGIVLGTKGNIIEKIKFPKEDSLNKEIILGNGAHLVFGEFTGKVAIKVQSTIIPQSTVTEPGIPCTQNVTRFENYCSDTSHLILILLIFSIFLNVTQILFDQPGKLMKSLVFSKIASRFNDPGAKDDDDDSIHSHEKPLLHEDYLLARRLSSLDSLQTRRVSVVQVSKPGEQHTEKERAKAQTTTTINSHERQEEDHQVQSCQKPLRQDPSSGRIRKRSLQKHGFWKGHKAPRHPLKRSVTIGTTDVKYYNSRKESLTNSQVNPTSTFPLADMKAASKSHSEL
ncbi:hypothetical protein SK128_003759 [Halocaridina rubra]|uniref:Uncharacterized protein n=1 Tax=Halocaridina rubra TaxID=373956 RepID=A0AAN8ZZP4_HALRR